MVVTTTFTIEGYRIKQYMGIVRTASLSDRPRSPREFSVASSRSSADKLALTPRCASKPASRRTTCSSTMPAPLGPMRSSDCDMTPLRSAARPAPRPKFFVTERQSLSSRKLERLAAEFEEIRFRSRPSAASTAFCNASCKRRVCLRNLVMCLPPLDEPMRVAPVFLDHRKRVRPAALGATVIVRQPYQVIATVDAKWLVLLFDRGAGQIHHKQNRHRQDHDDDLEPQ